MKDHYLTTNWTPTEQFKVINLWDCLKVSPERTIKHKKENKIKIDERYQYLNHHITKVENVNLVLNEKIDLYADGLDDEFEEMSNIDIRR